MPDRSAAIVIESSRREEFVDITAQVRAVIRASKVTRGVICLWCLHTTCALTVNEGADPDVARDLIRALGKLVPERADYQHAEGNSDAHIKTSLLGPGLTLLIDRSELVLGTWQHIFLAEWDGPRRREIAFMLLPT